MAQCTLTYQINMQVSIVSVTELMALQVADKSDIWVEVLIT